jgi:hypothetical protein
MLPQAKALTAKVLIQKLTADLYAPENPARLIEKGFF